LGGWSPSPALLSRAWDSMQAGWGLSRASSGVRARAQSGSQPRPSWGCSVFQSSPQREYRPSGSGDPGMPFSGFPVFPPAACDDQVSERRTSPRLPAPLQGTPTWFPLCCGCQLPSSHRVRQSRHSTTLLSSLALQRLPPEGPLNGGVAKSHRSPLTAFLRSQRAVPQRPPF